MSTATYIETTRDEPDAVARLYRLDPPYRGEGGLAGAEYVIVSAIGFGPNATETYIFPATETGEIADFGELPGSFQGDMDHERALTGLGYQIVEVEQQ